MIKALAVILSKTELFEAESPIKPHARARMKNVIHLVFR